jgi:leader peptidase (prepilin peptidase)/N-methyltransferase
VTALRLFVFGLFGVTFGSFLTVVIHRIPRREALVGGRSRCPSCGATISARDNVPILSYLFLRGRCRSCGAKISPRYPLVELAVAALFLGAAVAFSEMYVAGVIAVFLGVLLALAIIDVDHRVIPNAFVYPSLAVFLVALLVGAALGRDVNLIGAGVGLLSFGGGVLLVALIAPRGMGMGDVKLAALIGLVLGSQGLRYVAVAAGLAILAGGVGGLVALAMGRSRKATIPFGPYLVIGAIAAAFWAGPIARAYISLLS